MEIIVKYFVKIENIFHEVSQYALVLMMIGISISAISRYFINKTINFTFDITEQYLMVIIIFFSMSYVLSREGHVKIDILTNYVSEIWNSWFNLINSMFAFVFFVILTWQTTEVAVDSYIKGHLTSGLISFPLYTALSIIPLGSLIISLRFIFEIIDSIKKIAVKLR